jgi:class 3 adenylate cyclase
MAVSRRVQTLLFIDIVGSTTRLRDLGDAAWAGLLVRYHAAIRGVLAAHGGREVDTAGDGFLARFDAPASATRAAVAAVAAVAPLQIEIRAGLHAGEVELDGEAMTGVGVHLAARVMGEAGPGQVLVSATVRELMAGSGLGFVDLGVRELKGFAERWRLFAVDPATVGGDVADQSPGESTTEIEGRGATGVPFPGLLSVGHSAGYVGREELLRRLTQTRRQAAAGRCRAVLLCGEPGIGKTRTAAEVAQAAFDEGAIALYGRCDEEVGVPYQPFAEALDWYTGHISQPVLGRYPGELTRLQPLLGSRLAGLATPVSSDPRSEEYLLFEAARSWLVELSRQQPVALVVDDLQWASKPVLLLLRHVLRAAVAEGEGVRLLVLGTYRDTELGRDHTLAGVLADVRRLPGVEQLAMTGLSMVEVAELMSPAAGQELDEDGRRLAQRLHAETDGNPFFVAEVLRHLVETGMVGRHDHRWVARGGAMAVPQGVRDVIGRRLGRLSAQTNQMLSVAAVLGRDFDVELLATLRDAPEDSLLDALDAAVGAGLVQETGADRYRFAHVLVRATLLEGLSATRRRRLHRRVGETLEKLRPDDVVALAYHFSQADPDGEARSQAVRYGLAAAEQALQARALGDAEARFHQVLGLLEDSTPEGLARIQALCGLGEAQRDQGNAEFRTTLLEAGRLAQASADVPTLVRAALANSRGLPSMIGAVDTDRVAITEAALDSVGPHPTADRARLLAHLAAELCFAGDDQRRVALSDEAEGIARGLGDSALLAWVLNRTGYAAFAPDRVERLVARGEEATRLSDAAGDPAQRVLSRYYWSGALLTAGDLPGFRAVTATMLAVSGDAAPTVQRFAQFLQARVSLIDGRFDDAQRINDGALGQAQELGEPDAASWWASIAGALEMLRGGIAAVVDAIGEISSQYPDFPAWWITHAVVLAMVGRVQEARELLTRHAPDPEQLISDVLPFMAVSWLSWVPLYLDDAPLAARIATTLRPHRDYWAHPYSTVLGPVTLYLAMCAATTGDLDESVALFEESDRALAGFGCHGLLPFVRLTYAEVLLRRGSGNHRGRAIQLLDQVRQGAAAIKAPSLVAQADALSVCIDSEANS